MQIDKKPFGNEYIYINKYNKYKYNKYNKASSTLDDEPPFEVKRTNMQDKMIRITACTTYLFYTQIK